MQEGGKNKRCEEKRTTWKSARKEAGKKSKSKQENNSIDEIYYS